MDPEVNIRFGCLLLSLLTDRYADLRTALAAYNAGMGNVDTWLQDSAYSSDGRTLSDIPIEETPRVYRESIAQLPGIPGALRLIHPTRRHDGRAEPREKDPGD